MKHEKVQFEEQLIEMRLRLSPLQKWSLQDKFPFKLVLCLLLIVLSSTKAYFYSTVLTKEAEVFAKGMNYVILNHTDTGVYYGSTIMFNVPIHFYYSHPELAQHWAQLRAYFADLNLNIAGFVDQEELDQQAQQLRVRFLNGSDETFRFRLGQGILSPFNWSDPHSVRQFLSESAEFTISISFLQLMVYSDYTLTQNWTVDFNYQFYHKANIRLQIDSDFTYEIYRTLRGPLRMAPFRVVMAYFSYIIDSAILLFALLYGYLHLRSFLFKRKAKDLTFAEQFSQFPKLSLAVALANLSISLTSFTIDSQSTLNILAGLGAGLSWFSLNNYMGHIKNVYYVQLLLDKSPPFLLRWLVSSLPLFLGMVVYANINFSRLSPLFESSWSSFLSLFYICYYNMNYELMAVTSKSLFNYCYFFAFTAVFCYCVYGSLLVAMFCSFAWDAKEEEVQLNVLLHLKITCSSCNHKYPYVNNNTDHALLQRKFGISALHLAKNGPASDAAKVFSMVFSDSPKKSIAGGFKYFKQKAELLGKYLKYLCYKSNETIDSGDWAGGESLKAPMVRCKLLRDKIKARLTQLRSATKQQSKRKLQ